MTHRTLSQILAELTSLNKVFFFSNRIVDEWNSLPNNVRESNSIETLKNNVLSSIKDKRLEGASLIWYKVLSGGLLLHNFFYNLH